MQREHAGQAQFDLQLLHSQYLRAWALAVLFLVVLAWQTGIRLTVGMIPIEVSGLLVMTAGWEVALALALRRRIRERRAVHGAVWYLTSCIEVGAVLVMLLVARDSFDDPLVTLSTPPVIGLCIIIIASALRLEMRFCVFTGALAGFGFLALAADTLVTHSEQSLPPGPMAMPLFYVGKAIALMLVGICAGLVARELRQRLWHTLEAREEVGRSANANQLKTLFLANVSHEVRTPLNAIMGQAQLMAMDPHLTGAQRDALETITRSSDHLLLLVDDLINLARSEFEGETAANNSFGLDELLEELSAAAAQQCSSKGVDWGTAINARFHARIGDGRKLRQVLDNLIGNAIKFTSDGSVTMSVSELADAHIRFSVTDTGPGIAPDRLTHIFAPFLQDEAGMRHGGSGLGLAIASRYVELMGGELQVESTLKAGTTFSFEIPLPLDAEQTSGDLYRYPTRVKSLVAAQPIKALVVDDEADNRVVLRDMLTRIGVDVVEVSGGKAALDETAQHPFDVVFLDISMPGMSGTAAATALRARCTNYTPALIAVTAAVHPSQQEAIKKAGFDAYVGKPVRMDALYSVIAATLQVALEYEEATKSTPQTTRIHLPGPLRTQLLSAVASHNMTQIRRSLDELEEQDAPPREWCTKMRELVRRYDLDVIKKQVEDTVGV